MIHHPSILSFIETWHENATKKTFSEGQSIFRANLEVNVNNAYFE